jgi:uncharacterized membrane protein YfcA
VLDFLQITFPTSGVQTNIFVPPLASFVISFFTSMAGISGAFLLLPFQMSVLGFTTPSVTATNFVFNLVGPPGGIWRYSSEGRMAWPLAITMIAGLVPGIFAGYYLRVMFLPDPGRFKFFVGIVLLGIGVKLLKGLRAGDGAFSQGLTAASGRIAQSAVGLRRGRFDFMGRTYTFSTAGMAFMTFAVGVIGGTYGIGGGSIIAPFCVTLFALPIYTIAGAVLLGTLIASLAGVLFYSLIPIHGSVAPPDLPLGLLFGVGGFLGIYLGAKTQKHIPDRWIKVILGIVIIAVSARYLLQWVRS